MVINTQKSTSEDVGHWILLTIFTKNKTLVRCEVFDSLGGGRVGLPTLIHDYISSLQVDIKYSNSVSLFGFLWIILCWLFFGYYNR